MLDDNRVRQCLVNVDMLGNCPNKMPAQLIRLQASYMLDTSPDLMNQECAPSVVDICLGGVVVKTFA
ncbi:hypothetical protein M8J77_025341 [Diaphorina citri]|nr:hypothetical protein M8J77_025341 [Diaphorina citri]